MKKLIVLCLSGLLTCGFLYSQQSNKNVIGVSLGIVPAMMDMYFGMPWDFYPNRELSPVTQLFYGRQLISTIRIGAYIEMEKVKFTDQTGSNPHSFRRNNIGLNCIWQFPKTALHLQLGGYAGYGYLRANNWNDLTGLDMGGILGPAYEKEKLGVSVHLQSGYAGYKSSGTPESVKLYNPKILLKGYFKF